MEKDSLCNKWEMQMETTVKYHLTPIKMTTLKKKKKKQKVTSVDKNVRKLELFYTIGEIVKCCNYYQ